MGEEDAPPSSVEDVPSPAAAKKDWSSYISEELPRSVQESADTAIRSARSLHQSSSTHLRSLRVHPHLFHPIHICSNDDHAFCRILFPKSELDIHIMKRLSSTKLKVRYLSLIIKFGIHLQILCHL